jgi:uncharacterized repeat protein (TIGR01451 family)
LTLLKTVVNDNGGTAVDTDWTLSADGPTQGVSGIEGDPAITNAPVDAGDYTLAETNGPAGYTATAWTCQNAAGDPVTVTNATVPVAVGDNLTCTITNNDQAPVWTVAKSSDPESGTTVSPGSLITYTITATETGDVDPTGVVVTDNLTDVLAHATLVDGSLDPSTGNADVMGDSLVWNIDTLAGTQTLSYTVRVNDNAFDVTLRNAITATGSEPPEHCAGGIVPDAAVRVGTAARAPASTRTPTWTRTRASQHRRPKRCPDTRRPVTRWHRD